jgi:hypothetical protein
MELKFGPLTISVNHVRLTLLLMGITIQTSFVNGDFSHETNVMLFGTGFGWRITRDRHMPLTVGVFVALLTVPLLVSFEVGTYPEPSDADLDEMLYSIFGCDISIEIEDDVIELGPRTVPLTEEEARIAAFAAWTRTEEPAAATAAPTGTS